MKKANIIVLILIAAGIAVIVANFGKFGTYETFASAQAKPGTVYHVIGTLDSAKGMVYDPNIDANRFIFYAKDKEDGVHKVIFNGAKPQDFEKAEQLLMTGYMENGNFHCEKIQMKCPSKYQNDQIVVAKDKKA